MMSNITKQIQAWFAEHDDDGEFVADNRAIPFSVIGSARRTGLFIFTTKPSIVSVAMNEFETSEDYGMIGRYGLPSEADIDWISNIIGVQTMLFLGDMDPVDLMIFAWLRASRQFKSIIHLGINDTLLHKFDITLKDSLIIPCATSEQESLPFLREVFPDLNEIIGNNGYQMLEKGYKIELDAVMSDREKALPIMRSLRPLPKSSPTENDEMK